MLPHSGLANKISQWKESMRVECSGIHTLKKPSLSQKKTIYLHNLVVNSDRSVISRASYLLCYYYPVINRTNLPLTHGQITDHIYTNFKLHSLRVPVLGVHWAKIHCDTIQHCQTGENKNKTMKIETLMIDQQTFTGQGSHNNWWNTDLTCLPGGECRNVDRANFHKTTGREDWNQWLKCL